MNKHQNTNICKRNRKPNDEITALKTELETLKQKLAEKEQE